MSEVRNGDKKGNRRTKKEARLGSDVGENSEDELLLSIPKIHNDNDYIQYEITRINSVHKSILSIHT